METTHFKKGLPLCSYFGKYLNICECCLLLYHRSLIIVHEKWTIFIAGFCVWKLWCKLHLVTLPWFLPAAEHLASLVNCSNEYEAVGGEGVLRICPLDRFFERGGWKWPLLLPKRQFSIYLRFYSPFPSPWYRPSIWRLQNDSGTHCKSIARIANAVQCHN